MDDLNTGWLRFDIEPRDLVRLLRQHSKEKAGPFSWKTPSGEGEVGLYLDVRKTSKDGFECNVKTIRYRKPGGSFFAEDGLHVITLQGSRVRDGETLVLLKCHQPRARDPIFVHFCTEMDRLREQLVGPTSTPLQAHSPPSVSEAKQSENEPLPITRHSEVNASVDIDDPTLDAVDRKIIQVVESLERSGLRPTDELVAFNVPPNPQTDLPYSRVTINRRRCKLRDKGYNV